MKYLRSNVLFLATMIVAGGISTVQAILPPVITSPLTATGSTVEPFTYRIRATGAPTSFNAAGLPPGLTVATNTGVISGTMYLATPGTYKVTLIARNSAGKGSAILALTVRAGVPYTNIDALNETSEITSVQVFGSPGNASYNFGTNLGLGQMPWKWAFVGQVKTISANVMHQQADGGWRLTTCQIKVTLTQSLEIALQINRTDTPLPGDQSCNFYVYRN